jgi:fumarate hydratase subunit beta
MIGKGPRSQVVKDNIVKNKAVYFAAIGGAGALLAQCITAAEVVAFPELGTEAVHKLTIKDFPVIVINDIYGNDLYQQR